jgi:alkyl sulfatase BDS1-like metallo-beta-lactamase superfamily hydrolase
VVPGIYQVRGFDLSDISFVRGKTGWIVFDPLVTREVARAAWKLFQEGGFSRARICKLMRG